MAFKITDQALESLQGLSFDQRTAFLKKLDSQQLGEISAALPEWKSRRKMMSDAPAIMEPSSGDMNALDDNAENVHAQRAATPKGQRLSLGAVHLPDEGQIPAPTLGQDYRQPQAAQAAPVPLSDPFTYAPQVGSPYGRTNLPDFQPNQQPAGPAQTFQQPEGMQFQQLQQQPGYGAAPPQAPMISAGQAFSDFKHESIVPAVDAVRESILTPATEGFLNLPGPIKAVAMPAYGMAAMFGAPLNEDIEARFKVADLLAREGMSVIGADVNQMKPEDLRDAVTVINKNYGSEYADDVMRGGARLLGNVALFSSVTVASAEYGAAQMGAQAAKVGATPGWTALAKAAGATGMAGVENAVQEGVWSLGQKDRSLGQAALEGGGAGVALVGGLHAAGPVLRQGLKEARLLGYATEPFARDLAVEAISALRKLGAGTEGVINDVFSFGGSGVGYFDRPAPVKNMDYVVGYKAEKQSDISRVVQEKTQRRAAEQRDDAILKAGKKELPTVKPGAEFKPSLAVVYLENSKLTGRVIDFRVNAPSTMSRKFDLSRMKDTRAFSDLSEDVVFTPADDAAKRALGFAPDRVWDQLFGQRTERLNERYWDQLDPEVQARNLDIKKSTAIADRVEANEAAAKVRASLKTNAGPKTNPNMRAPEAAPAPAQSRRRKNGDIEVVANPGMDTGPSEVVEESGHIRLRPLNAEHRVREPKSRAKSKAKKEEQQLTAKAPLERTSLEDSPYYSQPPGDDVGSISEGIDITKVVPEKSSIYPSRKMQDKHEPDGTVVVGVAGRPDKRFWLVAMEEPLMTSGRRVAGGAYIIGKKGDKPELIDASLLRPMIPSGIATPDVAPKNLLAPVMPDLRMLPEETQKAFDDAFRLAKQLEKSNPAGIPAKLKRELVPSQFFGPKDLGAYVRAIQGAKNLGSGTEQKRVLDMLLRESGEKAVGAFDRDLLTAIQKATSAQALGVDVWQRIKQKHGKAWAAVEDFARPVIDELAENSRKIGELGGFDDVTQLLRDSGLKDEYIARLFYRHVLKPGEWAKLIPKSDFGVGINFIEAQFRKAKVPYDETALRREVESIIGMNDPLEAFKDALGNPKSIFSRASERLKSKNNDIAPEILALLGEIPSGMHRLSVSIAQQRSLLKLLSTYDQLAKDARFAAPLPFPNGPSLQVPNDPKQFGRLAGSYVHADLHDALVSMPGMVKQAPEFWKVLVDFQKLNLVAGAGVPALLKNAYFGVQGAIFSGVSINPIRTGKVSQDAWRMMMDYSKSPIATGDGWIFNELIGNTAIRPGFGATELKHMEELMRDSAIKSFIQPTTFFGRMGAMMKASARAVGKGYMSVAKANDIVDTWMRATTYLEMRPRIIKEFQAANPGKPFDWIVKEASDEVARRINMSFPNYDAVSRMTDRMRPYAGPLFSPFVVTGMEEMRVAAMLLPRMIGPNAEKGLALRIGGLAAMMGTVGKLTTDYLGDVSEDEWNTHEALLSKSRARNRPIRIKVPIKDGKGRPVSLDVTHWVPFGRLGMGDPTDPLLARLVTHAPGLVLNESASDLWAEGMHAAGVSRTPAERPLMESERAWHVPFKWGWNAGYLGPAGVARQYETLRKGGDVGTMSRSEEELTGGQQILRGITGITALPTTLEGQSPSRIGVNREYKGEQGALKREKKSVIRGSETVEEKRRRLEIIKERRQELADEMKERKQDIRR